VRRRSGGQHGEVVDDVLAGRDAPALRRISTPAPEATGDECHGEESPRPDRPLQAVTLTASQEMSKFGLIPCARAESSL
jgi:hypothetical protein